jgi:hypothetical protein
MMDNWHRNYTQEELKIVYPTYLDKQKYKEDFENIVATNVIERFRKSDLLNYNPATKEQLKEWSTWNFPDVLENINNTEAKLKQEWSTEKWDPFVEEEKVANMFQPARQRYMNSDRYKAYILYGKEQYNLLDAYNKSKTHNNLKDLYIHIWKHGKIIQTEIPPCPIIKNIDKDSTEE